MKTKELQIKTATELKEFYGEEYVRLFAKKSISRLKRLTKYIETDTSSIVVDFGCGNAMLMDIIAPKVMSYAGVDFSDEFIKVAKDRQSKLSIKNATFYCSDIESFCYDNEKKYDIAFAMDISEHIYDEKWLRILKAIKYCLKKNGKLYLHTPNAEFFIEIMKEKGFLLNQFKEHIAVRNAENNISLLKSGGFKNIELKLIPHYNILRFFHPISFLPLVGKYLKARIFIEAGRQEL